MSLFEKLSQVTEQMQLKISTEEFDNLKRHKSFAIPKEEPFRFGITHNDDPILLEPETMYNHTFMAFLVLDPEQIEDPNVVSDGLTHLEWFARSSYVELTHGLEPEDVVVRVPWTVTCDHDFDRNLFKIRLRGRFLTRHTMSEERRHIFDLRKSTEKVGETNAT